MGMQQCVNRFIFQLIVLVELVTGMNRNDQCVSTSAESNT